MLSLLQWRVTGYFGILATREHAAAQLALVALPSRKFAPSKLTNIIKLKLNTDKLIKLTNLWYIDNIYVKYNLYWQTCVLHDIVVTA